MSIFDKLTKLFTTQEVETRRQQVIVPSYAISLNQLGNFNTFAAAIKNWTYACIAKRAEAIAGLNWVIETETSSGIEYADDEHPVKRIFDSPNAYHTLADLFRLLQMYYDITGNSLLNVIKLGDKPVGMQVIPATNLSMDWSNRQLRGYIGIVGNETVRLSKEDAMHFRNLVPDGTLNGNYVGKSMVDRVIDIISTSEEMNGYLKSYFRNEGVPPLVAKIERDAVNEYTAEKQEEFRARWNSRMPNNPIAATTIGMEISPLATSNGAIRATITELDKLNKENIAAAFGIPQGLLTGDQQNRATAEVNERTFYNGTIEPLAKMYKAVLNQYFRQYFPDVNIYYESITYEDRELEQKLSDMRLKSGITTINEEREELGFDKIENPNADLHLIANNFIALEQLNQQPQEVPIENSVKLLKEKEVGKTAITKLSEEQKSAIWKATIDEDEKFENRYTGIIKNYFKLLHEEIKKNLFGGRKSKAARFKSFLEGSFTLFDIDEFDKRLTGMFSDDIRKQIIERIRISLEQIGSDYGSIETEFQQQIDSAIAQLNANIVLVNETVEAEIRDEIIAIAQANQDATAAAVQELIEEQIDKDFLARYPNRARTIARTTTTKARGEAQTRAWESSDTSIEFVWITERDGDVRDTHRRADGQTREKSGLFRVGSDSMKSPGGGSVARENINCRCVMIAELK